MFIEEETLLAALAGISNTAILPSTEYAVEKGGKYPSVSVDFGIWQMTGVSEDGAAYDVTPQYMVTLYVKPTPGNEAIQKAAARDLHNLVLAAIVKAFAGYQLTILGQPAGTIPFGASTAYAVVYQLDLGPMVATFT